MKYIVISLIFIVCSFVGGAQQLDSQQLDFWCQEGQIAFRTSDDGLWQCAEREDQSMEMLIVSPTVDDYLTKNDIELLYHLNDEEQKRFFQIAFNGMMDTCEQYLDSADGDKWYECVEKVIQDITQEYTK